MRDKIEGVGGEGDEELKLSIERWVERRWVGEERNGLTQPSVGLNTSWSKWRTHRALMNLRGKICHFGPC